MVEHAVLFFSDHFSNFFDDSGRTGWMEADKTGPAVSGGSCRTHNVSQVPLSVHGHSRSHDIHNTKCSNLMDVSSGQHLEFGYLGISKFRILK